MPATSASHRISPTSCSRRPGGSTGSPTGTPGRTVPSSCRTSPTGWPASAMRWRTASTALRRPDLLEMALLAGQRLVGLGSRPDGTIAVPHSIPLADPERRRVPSAGATGRPERCGCLSCLTGGSRGTAGLATPTPAAMRSGPAACPRGCTRVSGTTSASAAGRPVSARWHWTAIQADGDAKWLGWAVTLAQDVLNRRIEDESGVRWSHTEHRHDPPELKPDVGWMPGGRRDSKLAAAPGRVQREGIGAAKLWWPDNPVSA